VSCENNLNFIVNLNFTILLLFSSRKVYDESSEENDEENGKNITTVSIITNKYIMNL
jgi:hypothetical protein